MRPSAYHWSSSDLGTGAIDFTVFPFEVPLVGQVAVRNGDDTLALGTLDAFAGCPVRNAKPFIASGTGDFDGHPTNNSLLVKGFGIGFILMELKPPVQSGAPAVARPGCCMPSVSFVQ